MDEGQVGSRVRCPLVRVCTQPRRLRSVLQPGVVLAGVQPAGARVGRGHRASRCSSGCASARSTPRTWTSSTWCGWPGSSTRWRPGSTPAGPTACARATRSTASRRRVLELDRRLQKVFGGELRPKLEDEQIRIVGLDNANEEERRQIHRRFHEQVFPALTPLVIGLGRPFPYISNLSLSLAVLLRDPESGVEIVARVKVPKELLGRFLPVGEEGDLRAARADHRGQPRRALPGHRGRRLRLLPGHPRRRLHGRATRPTTSCRRSRTSCAGAASARSCGWRSPPG